MNNRLIIYIIIALLGGGVIGYILAPKAASEGHDHEEMAKTTEEEVIWTCAMHPQIRQNEPGLCPICEMELIPLDETKSDDPLVLEMSREAVKLSNIQTTEVSKGIAAGADLVLEGKIQPDERRLVSFSAHVPGRIEQLYVTFTGEQIRKGQQLANIYSPPLITAQREYLEAKKFADVSPGLLEAARQKLKRWKIPNEWIENLDNNGTIQETVTVYAESSGVVTERHVSVGDYVSEGSPLFDVVNLNRLWVVFEAYESDLSGIAVGDAVTFQVRALPDETFETEISYIDPVIDPETRTANVRATINNRGNLLKPEMFVTGRITEDKGEEKGTLRIPKSAVLWTGPRSVVYVKLPGREIPSFEYREVELGNRKGDQYEVLSGLKPGDEVVTYGAFVIDAAAQLNNQKSMMNKHVHVKGMSEDRVPDYREGAGEAFTSGLNQLLSRYLEMKDAFVDTNADSTAYYGKQLLAQMRKVDDRELTMAAEAFWQESVKSLEQHLNKVVGVGDIEQQRTQFAFISDLLIDVFRAFGVQKGRVYMQHCPMALDDDGANWLSMEKEIRNPYFGEKMMKCGIIKDTLGVDYQGE